MEKSHDQFPYTRRLCKLFRLRQRRRGLASGAGMSAKNVSYWEDVVRGQKPHTMTPKEVAEREQLSRIGCECLLINELTNCGLVPLHPSFPEPTGEAHPAILKLLAEDYPAMPIPVGVRVERPDVF